MIVAAIVSPSSVHLVQEEVRAPPDSWRVSPAYDLNPAPVGIRPWVLSIAIDVDGLNASIDLALGAADCYGLKQTDAGELPDRSHALSPFGAAKLQVWAYSHASLHAWHRLLTARTPERCRRPSIQPSVNRPDIPAL